jgi:hypothetical protein
VNKRREPQPNYVVALTVVHRGAQKDDFDASGTPRPADSKGLIGFVGLERT